MFKLLIVGNSKRLNWGAKGMNCKSYLIDFTHTHTHT